LRGRICVAATGIWSIEDHLGEFSAQGDPLEKLLEIVDFELFVRIVRLSMV